MKNLAEKDEINEAFDDIFLAEEKILEEGYEKGFEEGRRQGNTEAYHLGKFPCFIFFGYFRLVLTNSP